MTRYTSATESDRAAMLAEIGVGSIEELFAELPVGVRVSRELALGDGMAEHEVYAHLRELAARNVSLEDELSFLGAGMYDHYVPALVDAIVERSEFLTPYTPYQPEVSQGTLQVMFEFQTAICELTGLPVSNASVYDGPSAVAAAAYLATLTNGRSRLVCSAGLHPHARAALATAALGYGCEVVEVPLSDGATDEDALTQAIEGETAAVFLAQPNFLGAVEELERLVERARSSGALVVCVCDPIALGVLRPPGELGVDIVVGEGQPLGNHPAFGGPTFGFFAAAEQHLRKLPGRIAGETTDVDGRRGFVLTLQAREQHIRRERATSNICTAQALNALAAIVYLSWLGRRGLVELGELLLQRTHYARQRLCELDGVEALHELPVVREFALRLDAPVAAVIERCRRQGVNPGLALERVGLAADGLLVAITERRSRADIDRLVDVLGAAVAAERVTAQERA